MIAGQIMPHNNDEAGLGHEVFIDSERLARLETIETAAQEYYAAYRAECVVHASDGDDWGERMTDAHGVRQDAEDCLFLAVDATYVPD